MNEGLKKFRELLLTDEEFQGKLKTAAENYDGEQTEEALFHGVIEPLAAEYGITATYEEYTEYIRNLSQDAELSVDEIKQVAGGKVSGAGAGILRCEIIGFGAGAGGGSGAGGACSLIGVGKGIVGCMTAGVSGTLDL